MTSNLFDAQFRPKIARWPRPRSNERRGMTKSCSWMRKISVLAVATLLVGAESPVPSWAASPSVATATQSETAARDFVIVMIGDSLTQGYGVRSEEAFPALVEKRLREKLPARITQQRRVRVINGGISGSVTAEADRRLKWYLKSKPDLVLIALGANDGFKGTPPSVMKANLQKAIDLAKAEKLPVVLGGMRMLTNLGSDYVREFERVYKDLAKENQIELIPFLLEGVALEKKLNQSDMRHPNALGHQRIAERVSEVLERMILREVKP
jgi:acyl-CoA thioesterase-1